ncbi:LCP family protein [Corynebacterium timonense]|uniref:Cell envelope-related function transcriptional attenuator common domain-containing protein n=1 Tax=Corynebacterium timonense TaxID=441500 RepID=A0A1H1V450_9CORY|nr:LCP family protein [Corynebacterium timonense]SDS79281.1 cell envelope-related function transcriptional attenuator common domain-containing protein [Corynebacterium timonense]
MSHTPRSNDPRDNLGDYVVGKDGRPVVDRYGRPVRRRESAPRPEPRRRPQQHMPPEQTRYEPRRPPEAPMRVARSRPAAPPPPRRRPRRRRSALPGCVASLALILALIVAGVLLTDARLTRVNALPQERIANTAGTNWLLVGSDSRVGLSEEDAARLGTGGDIGSTRTDTIMLLHLPLRGQPTLVSIPRDSYVEVPGYGYDKINAAFSYGGPALLTATVEQATGLRVDRYAEIGMGGLAGVVDAVGGVDICVAEPIDDPLANISLQPGCQRMDGPTALGYVRTRATALGDLDRVQRQREFMAALIDRVFSPAVLLNPLHLVRLVSAAPRVVTVNTDDHIWNLARIPLALRGGLTTETVPVGGFADTEVGSVILWDDAAAEALFSALR